MLKLNDVLIDVKKISYVGKPDTIIKSHLNVTIHFFKVISDGCPIDIESRTKEELLNLREKLVDQINSVVGYLPG